MNALSFKSAARLALAALVAGCGTGTSVLLTITGVEGSTQLRIQGSEAGEPVFGPVVRPDPAGDPLVSPQTLRLRFTSGVRDAPLLIEVEGLDSGAVISGGSGQISIVRDSEGELQVALTARGAPCGATGAPCASGQRCSEGQCVCDATSCSSGCCSANQCRPGTEASACGAGGGACATCGGAGSDRCVSQACSCGPGGAACATGQRCDTGGCICDSSSCPDGCCSSGQCVAGTSNDACGNGGGACESCGQGRECSAAQTCECNPTSCPDGCCDATGQCKTSGFDSLDCVTTGGAACSRCDSAKASQCDAGVCKCGSAPACDASTSCVANICV